jgi:hypothetical protein
MKHNNNQCTGVNKYSGERTRKLIGLEKHEKMDAKGDIEEELMEE